MAVRSPHVSTPELVRPSVILHQAEFQSHGCRSPSTSSTACPTRYLTCSFHNTSPIEHLTKKNSFLSNLPSICKRKWKSHCESVCRLLTNTPDGYFSYSWSGLKHSLVVTGHIRSYQNFHRLLFWLCYAHFVLRCYFSWSQDEYTPPTTSVHFVRKAHQCCFVNYSLSIVTEMAPHVHAFYESPDCCTPNHRLISTLLQLGPGNTNNARNGRGWAGINSLNPPSEAVLQYGPLQESVAWNAAAHSSVVLDISNIT